MDDIVFSRVTDAPTITGKQGQMLRTVLSEANAPGLGFSWLEVTMPSSAEGISVPHVHRYSAIAVRLRTGRGVTLTGDDLSHYDAHGPGEVVAVKANVLHVAVNLDPGLPDGSVPGFTIVGDEIRNDPHGNNDVIAFPEMHDLARRRAAQVRALDAAGALLDRGDLP
jgi:uncharacterized RmlC-like cupin family protein